MNDKQVNYGERGPACIDRITFKFREDTWCWHKAVDQDKKVTQNNQTC